MINKIDSVNLNAKASMPAKVKKQAKNKNIQAELTPKGRRIEVVLPVVLFFFN